MDDWYHVGWIAGRSKTHFHSISEARNKYAGEGLRGPTKRILNLFRRNNVIATFFIQGEIALEYPELIKTIMGEGHEIASHDMHHISPRIRSLQQFKKDVRKSLDILQKISGERPVGYRAPNGELKAVHLEVMERIGIKYDSSVYPCLPIPGFYGWPKSPMQPYRIRRSKISKSNNSKPLLEFPHTVLPHARVPAGSGWYLRNLGLWFIKKAIKSQLKHGYASFFFHPYEISEKVPKVVEVPFHVFRGVGASMYDKIENLIQTISNQAKFVDYRTCIEKI